ncbi:MAG: hypothetical protein V8T46_01205 [Sutterella seckii]
MTEGQETDLKRYLVGAAYEYPLSKHTHLYASANWTHGSGLFDQELLRQLGPEFVAGDGRHHALLLIVGQNSLLPM